MKVLVVDDSATLRKIAIKAVKDAGFAVEFAEAGDGHEALEELEKHEFALVLSDLNMPKMDGVELVQRVRTGGSRVPIVILAAEGGLARLEAALAAGADDCLRNPFTPQQFRSKLGRFLG